jgi:hypothetical protein
MSDSIEKIAQEMERACGLRRPQSSMSIAGDAVWDWAVRLRAIAERDREFIMAADNYIEEVELNRSMSEHGEMQEKTIPAMRSKLVALDSLLDAAIAAYRKRREAMEGE